MERATAVSRTRRWATSRHGLLVCDGWPLGRVHRSGDSALGAQRPSRAHPALQLEIGPTSITVCRNSRDTTCRLRELQGTRPLSSPGMMGVAKGLGPVSRRARLCEAVGFVLVHLPTSLLASYRSGAGMLAVRSIAPMAPSLPACLAAMRACCARSRVGAHKPVTAIGPLCLAPQGQKMR